MERLARTIGGLNKVVVLAENGNWIELTDKTLMKIVLLEEFERCVNQ